MVMLQELSYSAEILFHWQLPKSPLLALSGPARRSMSAVSEKRKLSYLANSKPQIIRLGYWITAY